MPFAMLLLSGDPQAIKVFLRPSLATTSQRKVCSSLALKWVLRCEIMGNVYVFGCARLVGVFCLNICLLLSGLAICFLGSVLFRS